MLRTYRWLLLLLLLLVNVFAHAQVNVYSSRKEALIKPLLQEFTRKTGIAVQLLTGKDDALLKRLSLEGEASPADILIATDVARLYRAKKLALTQAVHSDRLMKRIPVAWRDFDNHWFGVTSRARPIIYAKNRVDTSELLQYEDLAQLQWKGRLCLRSSDNVYNQSLVAAALLADGAELTLKWMQAMVNNLARPPAGGDTDQIRAVAAGVCDLTVANTYYLARLARSDNRSDNAVANQVAVLWPNQQDRGAHFNISGIALTMSAKNKVEAVQLMEYMVSDEAQRWYADVNNEYPVVDTVDIPEVLAGYGKPKVDDISLGSLGELNQQVIRLMDQAGWR